MVLTQVGYLKACRKKEESETQIAKAIVEKLKELGLGITTYKIIPDHRPAIENEVKIARDGGLNLLIFTGGTGLSVRDITPESLRPLLDREIPGIAEVMRSYGQERTAYSMLSRSLAGFASETLVLALPGSTNGAKESMEALFPAVLHVFDILKGQRHD